MRLAASLMIKWRCDICRRIKVERFILVDALNKVYIVSRETLICADISA